MASDSRNGVTTMMQCVTVVTFIVPSNDVTVVTFIVTSDDVTVVTFSNVTTVMFAAHSKLKPNYVFIRIYRTLNILAHPIVVYGCWGRNTNFKVYTAPYFLLLPKHTKDRNM